MTLDPKWRNSFPDSGVLPARKAPKRKVFVSYHHEQDQFWANRFTAQFSDQYEVFQDQSLDDEVDSDDAEYVNRAIREDYIYGSSITIVLCGSETWKRRYVDWEIRSTLHYQHALLGVLIPGTPAGVGQKYVVPGRLFDNIQSGYAMWVAWPSSAQEINIFIEKAVTMSRSVNLVRNSREKLKRNRP
jgi:MTH538 TIR-like domain (DUF1863)